MTQATALAILKTGVNVFLTGEPGSGKTHLINRYVAYLKTQGITPSVTASTGIAATHIGGMTIHSWSGIGIKRSLSEFDLDALSSKEYLVKRLTHAKVLIIDEISMLDAETFATVDRVCRSIRRKPDTSFGGLQLIVVGDFFQLPPISSRGEAPARFVFESASWRGAEFFVCYLSEQHRHTDPAHSALLARIRRGEGDEEMLERLSALCEEGEVIDVDGADVLTQLYTHNEDVDRINTERLHKLPGTTVSYPMSSQGKPAVVDQIKRGCLSPETLELKEGAAVMFTKNDFESGFVNGTLGTVERFEEGQPVVLLRSGKRITVAPMEWSIEENGKLLGRINQLPLRLAWAITVHKSQGMSLDAAAMDLSKTFEYGQGYVALSRVRTLSGVMLKGINGYALRVHPQIVERDEHFRERSEDAAGAFESLSSLELSQMHRNFIKLVGGKAGATREGANTRAYKPWTKEEEKKLTQLFKKGESVTSIATALGRKPGGIYSRLAKLGLGEEN